MRKGNQKWVAQGLLAKKIRRIFSEFYGVKAEMQRTREITDKPSKVWRGRTVYLMRCEGDFGKGPHDMWIEEHWLWSLVSIQSGFLCPFHR